jgi:hypothetical protein
LIIKRDHLVGFHAEVRRALPATVLGDAR